MNPYESDRLLAEYLVFHYGSEEETLGGRPGPREALDFPVRCVRELLDAARVPDAVQALDIGCAVGRSSFELARHAIAVTGIDYSRRFIEAAEQLKTAGELMSHKIEEGAITSPFRARIPGEIDRKRVRFEEGDAMNLRPGLAAADILLAANLICRLPEPRKFLDRLPSLLRPGGQLLLATPFSWLEEYTPRENWLGGQTAGQWSFDALKEILDPDFALDETRDLPFLIREHSRKFQYGISLGSRWIRR